MRIIPKFASGSMFAKYDTTSTYSSGKSSSTTKSTTKTSSKSSSDDDDLTQEDIKKAMANMEGLKGDLWAYNNKAQAILKVQNLMMSPGLSASQYMQSQYELAQMKFDKDMWVEAFKDAKEKGTLGEYAITPYGQLVVIDKDSKQLNTVSVDEFDPETMSALNNYALLEYRNKMPESSLPEQLKSAALFSTVENAMSFEKFQALVNSAKNTLGTTEYNESGITNKNALAGLQTLAQADKATREAFINAAMDGVYTYDKSHSDNIKQINSLLSYLVAALPKNAKVWAALKTNIKNENEAALKLVGTYLASGSINKDTFEIEWKDTVEKLTHEDEKAKGEKSAEDIKAGPATKWLMGAGDSANISINIGTGKDTIVHAITMPLTDKEGKYLGVNTSLQAGLSGEYNTILDTNSVSMGMNIIDSSSFNHVIMRDGKIASIDFPCIHRNGQIIPDLSKETVEKKKAADAELKGRGIDPNDKAARQANYRIINEVYTHHQLVAPYDDNGEINSESWHRFGVINGIADETALGGDPVTSTLTRISNDSQINNIVNIIKGFDSNYEYNSGWFSSDEVYSGTIWIPVKESYVASTASQQLSPGQVNDLEAQDQALVRAKDRLMTRQLGDGN